MADELDVEIEAAMARGEQKAADEPRATAARYDPTTGLVHLTLSNDCLFAFPARQVQGLEDARDADLAEIEIPGVGFGLHWARLDVDVSVPGLLAGIFGTRAWMDRRRAAHAGPARSPAKAEASRRNGARGGRPRESAAEG